MPLSLRWIDESEWDRLAEIRLHCYAHATKELDNYRDRLHQNPRSKTGQFLLAERDGQAVGTATALQMTMWVRGSPLPCQGIAWVGTSKTHRRRGADGEPGVATQLMRETLRMARDRGQIVSALMPFRASFYEHFGYGIVERLADWTLPLEILPGGPSDGVRFFEPANLDALVACRQRIAAKGQCDIERLAASFQWNLSHAVDGFVVVDHSTTPLPNHPTTPIKGWLNIRHAQENGKDILRIWETGFEDIPSLLRLLHFLSSLKDQYAVAEMTLPAELPLNRLLRETQLPHRAVNHPVASVHPYTRMQLRILDHKSFLESLHLPFHASGQTTIAIRETEGHTTHLSIELSAGRMRVKPATAEPHFTCTDVTWSAVASGDLPASKAARLGLADCSDPSAAALLDIFAVESAPYCMEYF